MLTQGESKNLRKSLKRLAIFLPCVFLFDAFICFLFYSYTKLSPIVCGVIIIAITSVLYLLFWFICVKIEARKKKKLEKSGKKDPFSKDN